MYQQQQAAVSTENLLRNSDYARNMKEVVEKWAKGNAGKRVVNYRSAVERILCETDYDIGSIDREMMKNLWKKFGWSDRNIWPLTAWNSFCRFGAALSPDAFPPSCIIQKERQGLAALPPQMAHEIEDILAAHVVRTTGSKIKKQSQRQILRSFEAFRDFVVKILRHSRKDRRESVYFP
jgi:hypothetical protein